MKPGKEKETLITTHFWLLYAQVGKPESQQVTHLCTIHLTVEIFNGIWYRQETKYNYIQLYDK